MEISNTVGPSCNHLKLSELVIPYATSHLLITSDVSNPAIFFTGDLPTLPKLLNFPSEKGKIDIRQRIGTNYDTFGILLLNDDTGERVKVISAMYRGDASRINLDILREWLAGKGKTPVTWRTLIDTIQEADLTVLAGDIKNVISLMCSCHTSAVK